MQQRQNMHRFSLAIAALTGLVAFSGTVCAEYLPSGVLSVSTISFMEKDTNEDKAKFSRVNEAMPKSGLPPVRLKHDDICFSSFSIKDDDGNIISYSIIPESMKQKSIQYGIIWENKCTFNRDLRLETCISGDNSEYYSPEYYLYYPHDNYYDYIFLDHPAETYEYRNGSKTKTVETLVPCDAYKDTLLSKVQNTRIPAAYLDIAITPRRAAIIRASVEDDAVLHLVQQTE
jgi:hypothetical protein